MEDLSAETWADESKTEGDEKAGGSAELQIRNREELHEKPGPDHYLPFGTIKISLQHLTRPVPLNWKDFNQSCLTEISSSIGPLLSLIAQHWVRASFKAKSDQAQYAVIRVYVLPDDVDRSLLPRSARKTRIALRSVLDMVNCSPRSWEFREDDLQKEHGYEASSSEDDSLFYIFNTLPSPCPAAEKVEDIYSAKAIQDLLKGRKMDEWLNTNLYQYQRRSSAMMIQREVQPQLRPDPRLEQLTGPTGKQFFLDRENCEILSEQRSYHDPQGGILAETMGYGKTLICLSTILFTKGRLPEIPPEHSTNWVQKRELEKPTRSLPEICAASIARNNVQWRQYFQDLAKSGIYHDGCVEFLEGTIGCYTMTDRQTRSRRVKPVTHTIYLASTTLVVVPPNLLTQWQREIQRHLKTGSLNILILENQSDTLPEAGKLRHYDMVLMSALRFEEELVPRGGARTSADGTFQCSCANPARRRLCQEHPYRSPLLDVHFLRIIVDEGQRFVSSSTTQAIIGLSTIKVERRWLVSGTPAGALVGAEVGLAAEESFQGTLHEDLNGCSTDDALDSTTGREYPEANIEHQTQNHASSKVTKSISNRQKIVDLQEERKSIERLGSIVRSFLGVRPWANETSEDKASWNVYVVPTKHGARKPLSLRHVLNGLVVRHQYEDVEADLQLPPLENKLVYLRPSFYDKLSMNLFVLTLTSNAVTSERTDQDYMFHPKSRKPLEALIKNLRHCGFSWSGFSPTDIEKTCQLSRTYLDNPEKVVHEEDRLDLRAAIIVGEMALQSAAWQAFHSASEMGLFVSEFPRDCTHAWALCPNEETLLDPLLIGATEMSDVQLAVEDELYADDFLKCLRTLRRRNRLQKNKDRILDQDSNEQEQSKAHTSPNKGIPQSGLQETKKISAAQFLKMNPRAKPKPLVMDESHEADSVGNEPAIIRGPKPILKTNQRKPDVPLTYAAFSQTKLVGTASAKLSYLIDRVCSLYKEEKILVFYEGDDIAWYCAQVLELLDVPHLIYANGIAQGLRNKYQALFNSGSAYRVMFMDLKQAALGLHMASASRVFFINPVWQPNIEAQAIKRAHRIGQTRPVFVETLVLEGTIEEEMLKRRKNMTAEEHQKAARSLLDDNRMKNIIQGTKVLPISYEETENPDRRIAWLQQPQQLFGRSIAEAYGSPTAINEALSKSSPADMIDTAFKNSPQYRSVSEVVEAAKAAVPHEASKKRKINFVDEVERDHGGKVRCQHSPHSNSFMEGYVSTPETFARRKVLFADEKNLPLTSTYLLTPPDTDAESDEGRVER